MSYLHHNNEENNKDPIIPEDNSYPVNLTPNKSNNTNKSNNSNNTN